MSNYIKDLDYIRDFMAEKNLFFWRVEGLGKSAYRYGQNDEEKPPEVAFIQLKKLLDRLTGAVVITIQKGEFGQNGGDTRTGIFRFQYDCTDDDQESGYKKNQPTTNGMPSVFELMQQNFDLKMQLELNKIKQELSPATVDQEAEKSKLMMQTTMFNRIMGIFDGKPTAPAPINSNTSAPEAAQPKPATAGGGNAQTEDGKKVMDALQRLKNMDPEIVDRLQMLAKLAEEKPDMYKMAVDTLKSM